MVRKGSLGALCLPPARTAWWAAGWPNVLLDRGAEDWRADYLSEFSGAASWVTEQRVDHTRELPSTEIPACLIWGDKDPISPTAPPRSDELLRMRSRAAASTSSPQERTRWLVSGPTRSPT